MAKATGIRVPKSCALATAVELQGTRVASSCTATVEIADATSSRVQPACPNKPVSIRPINKNLPRNPRVEMYRQVIIGIPAVYTKEFVLFRPNRLRGPEVLFLPGHV